MTVTDDHQTLHADWQRWHDEREETLREPHGWLALTALEWLDEQPRAFADLPGTWRAPGGGTVEIAAAAADGVEVDGERVDGTRVVTPVDGAPGVLVTVGERVVELARRTDSYALRVRDPQAPTRLAFRGVPHFPVDARWVLAGRFEPYEAPQRITVGAVVDGLAHFPTAVGTVVFDVDGREHRLVALAGKGTGLTLHFHDATNATSTYGGGRILRTEDPDGEGSLVVDLNRTVNLPCAFTAFATCPLPPADNVLDLAVEAGEKRPDPAWTGPGRTPGNERGNASRPVEGARRERRVRVRGPGMTSTDP